jgi:hypothetical protein
MYAVITPAENTAKITTAAASKVNKTFFHIFLT